MGTVIRSTVLAAIMIAATGVGSASADETGLAQALHAFRKVGKKTCFVDHSHAGSGSGPNRKSAEAAAIGSWVSFTATEYGTSWGDFRIATDKSISCGSNGPNNWSCNLDATPCRPY